MLDDGRGQLVGAFRFLSPTRKSNLERAPLRFELVR